MSTSGPLNAALRVDEEKALRNLATMRAPHRLLLLSVLAACGSGPQADQVERSQKEFELAVGLWQEQNAPGAYQHLYRAIELDPDNSDAHLLLGNLFLLRRDFKQAEKHLTEALRIRERFPEARNSLGVLYIHRKNFPKAIAHLKIATQDLLNREPHLAWGNLGWAYTEQGNHVQALQALNRAVQLQPRFCVGHFRMGQNYFSMKRYGQAEEALTAALEVEDPSCQSMQGAWQLRGLVRVKRGRPEQAVDDFERCVEISGESETGRSCRSFLETAS